MEGQAVDLADAGFGSRLDRVAAGVARSPGRAAVVDAAALPGLQARRYQDKIAGGDALFDRRILAPHEFVETAAKSHHADDRERREGQPFGPLGHCHAGQPEQSDQRGGDSQKDQIELGVDDEHFDTEQPDTYDQPTPPGHRDFSPDTTLHDTSARSIGEIAGAWKVARAARPPASSNDYGSDFQISAAMRPPRPSRRKEKNRSRSANVHHAPPCTSSTPSVARRRRARPTRSACQRPRELAVKCAAAPASLAVKAARTSSPTSKCFWEIAGPSHAVSSPAGTSSAATVFSSTPAASPRQPACAAPMRRPSRAANNTGRQSATMMAQAQPAARVTAASAVTGEV